MKNKSLFILVGAVLLGGISGFLLTFLPPDATASVSTYVLSLPCNVFLTVLRYVAGPLIFLSLIESIYGCGDLKTFGKIGKNAFLRFIFYSFLAGIISVVFAVFFFGIPLSGEGDGKSEWMEVLRLFAHFIPENPWDPFLLCDLLQISFMAIVLGFVLLLLGKRAKVVVDVLKKIEKLFFFFIRIIGKVIPVYVFLSSASIVLAGEKDTVLHLWRLVICYLCASALMVVFILIRTKIVTKQPILTTIRNILPPFLIALTTANSTMALDEHFKTAEEKNGISDTTSRFAVPLAMSIFKPSSIMYLAVIGCYFLSESGSAVSVSRILTAALTATLLTLSIPPIPGGGINCYTVLFHQIGVSDGFLPIALALNAFMEFPITGLNNFSQPPEILILETKAKRREKRRLDTQKTDGT